MGVGVGSGVAVGIAVAVGTIVGVGVATGVGIAVGTGVAVGAGVAVGTSVGVGIGVDVGPGVAVGAGVFVGGAGVASWGSGGARAVAKDDGKSRGSTTSGASGSKSGRAPNSNAAAMVCSTLGVGGRSDPGGSTREGSAASEPLHPKRTDKRTNAMMPASRCRPIHTTPLFPVSPANGHIRPRTGSTLIYGNNYFTPMFSYSLASGLFASVTVGSSSESRASMV